MSSPNHVKSPRALILCPEAPYPLHGGGAFRSAALLNYLAQRYETDAVFFAESTRPDPRRALPAGLVRDTHLFRLPVHSRGTPARAWRNGVRFLRGVPPLVDRFTPGAARASLAQWLAGRAYDVAVIEHFWCAPYAALLRERTTRLVIDLHNIESEWHERMAEPAGFTVARIHRRFAAAARRLEQRWLSMFDTVLVTSGREVPLAKAGGAANVEVYPNTIPSPQPAPADAPPPRQQVVFSANFEYQPNIAGVKWFGQEVWPLLQRRHPGLEWLLVGRRPEAVRSVLPAGRVRTTGEVPDAIPHIRASLAAVVPIHSGSGTRIKILEAWAAGTPVISTTIGAEGLPPDALAIADRPEAFAAKVSAVIASQVERERWVSAGTEAFNKTFTWEAGWKVLEQLRI